MLEFENPCSIYTVDSRNMVGKHHIDFRSASQRTRSIVHPFKDSIAKFSIEAAKGVAHEAFIA